MVKLTLASARQSLAVTLGVVPNQLELVGLYGRLGISRDVGHVGRLGADVRDSVRHEQVILAGTS